MKTAQKRPESGPARYLRIPQHLGNCGIRKERVIAESPSTYIAETTQEKNSESYVYKRIEMTVLRPGHFDLQGINPETKNLATKTQISGPGSVTGSEDRLRKGQEAASTLRASAAPQLLPKAPLFPEAWTMSSRAERGSFLRSRPGAGGPRGRRALCNAAQSSLGAAHEGCR